MLVYRVLHCRRTCAEDALFRGKNGIDDPVARQMWLVSGERSVGVGRKINQCISFQPSICKLSCMKVSTSGLLNRYMQITLHKDFHIWVSQPQVRSDSNDQVVLLPDG